MLQRAAALRKNIDKVSLDTPKRASSELGEVVSMPASVAIDQSQQEIRIKDEQIP